MVKLTPLNFDGIVLDQKQNVMVYFYADFSKESKQNRASGPPGGKLSRCANTANLHQKHEALRY